MGGHWVAASTMGLMVLVACGRGASAPVTGQEPGATPTTIATTTQPASPATTANTVPTGRLPSPTEAAGALFAAWRAQDRAAALKVAVPAAVDALFSVPPGPVQDRSCQTGTRTPIDCFYRYGDRGISLRAEREGAGWFVRSVQVI